MELENRSAAFRIRLKIVLRPIEVCKLETDRVLLGEGNHQKILRNCRIELVRLIWIWMRDL